MDLDVTNIDKNDKNTWRKIYEAIGEPYFGGVKLIPRAFLNLCKNHPNEPQKNPADIKIFFNCTGRKFIYSGGEDSS